MLTPPTCTPKCAVAGQSNAVNAIVLLEIHTCLSVIQNVPHIPIAVNCV